MKKYELKTVESSFGDIEILEHTDDNGVVSFIPITESNSDYQRYLRWLNGEDESGTLS